MDISLLLSTPKSAPKQCRPGQDLLNSASPVSVQGVSAVERLHLQMDSARLQARNFKYRADGEHVVPPHKRVKRDLAEAGKHVPLTALGPSPNAKLTVGVTNMAPGNYSDSHVKTYICKFPGCSASFGQKGSLTRHLKSRHEKLRPHACDLCEKSFSEKWTLNVHRRNVHEKRKPHKCHLCGKTFGERWNLQKHINVVHDKIKPYICSICSRAFGYKGDMRKHVMELHVQDGRPFQCQVPSCGVKFARLRYLRRHQNLSHRGLSNLFDDESSHRKENSDQEQKTLSTRELTETSVITWYNSDGQVPSDDGESKKEMEPGSYYARAAAARGSNEDKADCSALKTLSMYASTARMA